MPDLAKCPRLLIRNVEYERHEGHWFYLDDKKRKCRVLHQTNGIPLAAALDEIVKLCEEHPRHGGWRPGWQENAEQAKRIRELEAELQSAKEMNQHTAALEQEGAKKDTLIEYWRGIAKDYRVEVERSRSVGADMNKKVRGLEQQLHNQREQVEDMARLSRFIQRFPNRIAHTGERYVEIAIRCLTEWLEGGDVELKPEEVKIIGGTNDPLEENVGAGLENAGYKIVDGTGERGTAPAEASPREIAERAAADRLDRECLFDARQRRAVAAVIAAGVEAYHQAQQEDGGG